ncbi:MAG: FAD-dependent monooxygenase [Nocardioidaceae bacterium]
MDIVCVGGGPAGLYFAISAKLRDPSRRITVVERNPAGVTYGWGVTFSERLLDSLYRNDRVSARKINEKPASWNNQEVCVRGGRPVHLGGYGFAIGRKLLLDILARRAAELGVDVRFDRAVEDPSEFSDSNLIIACDGANSRVRTLRDQYFRTDADVGRNKYIWLGTHRVFDSFVFAFEETVAGWIWFYAYRFNADSTTFIVECSQETWEGLGFDVLGPDESLRLLEDIFKRHLDGHSLINPMRDLGKTPWLNFVRISTAAWYRGNVVLMGDAAHTTHFSIGSGTTLAIQDAIALADKLDEHREVRAALAAYQEERRSALLMPQGAALNSTRWFENVNRYIGQEPRKFGYELWKRRGQSPSWRYPLHLATQVTLLRKLRSSLSSTRRDLQARRRVKLADSPQRGAAGVAANQQG